MKEDIYGNMCGNLLNKTSVPGHPLASLGSWPGTRFAPRFPYYLFKVWKDFIKVLKNWINFLVKKIGLVIFWRQIVDDIFIENQKIYNFAVIWKIEIIILQ